ncbi:MAG: hypothetical protein ABEJ31_08365 [Haloarculaceae archaeon]
MGKETVRYPDALVARIEEIVADSDVFESKSEFHRFASEYLLCVLDPDHDSSVLGFEDILADLEDDEEVSLSRREPTTGDGDVPFMQAYVRVRRDLMHGDVQSAREYVAETYDLADREALLLDELIGRYRRRQAVDPPRRRTRDELAPREPSRSPEEARIRDEAEADTNPQAKPDRHIRLSSPDRTETDGGTDTERL